MIHRYRFISDHHAIYGLARLCRVLAVKRRQGYYEWRLVIWPLSSGPFPQSTITYDNAPGLVTISTSPIRKRSRAVPSTPTTNIRDIRGCPGQPVGTPECEEDSWRI